MNKHILIWGLPAKKWNALTYLEKVHRTWKVRLEDLLTQYQIAFDNSFHNPY